MGPFQTSTIVNASAERVWATITNPSTMLQWMGDPELELTINTTWTVGDPIVITGFHHARFENKGTVLAFDPPSLLRYDQLSSISRLPDAPASYSIIEFRIIQASNPQHQTQLIISISNFPTESIFKHLEFYWKNTIGYIKKTAEEASV